MRELAISYPWQEIDRGLNECGSVDSGSAGGSDPGETSSEGAGGNGCRDDDTFWYGYYSCLETFKNQYDYCTHKNDEWARTKQHKDLGENPFCHATCGECECSGDRPYLYITECVATCPAGVSPDDPKRCVDDRDCCECEKKKKKDLDCDGNDGKKSESGCGAVECDDNDGKKSDSDWHDGKKSDSDSHDGKKSDSDSHDGKKSDTDCLDGKEGKYTLVVRPAQIFLDGEEICSEANNCYSECPHIEPEAGGLRIGLENDVSVWLQQGHDYVNAELFVKAAPDFSAGMTGLCGNADGNLEDDKLEMINGASKVSLQDSIFLAPAFRFLGCVAKGKVYDGAWQRQHQASNAEMCALSCKGFQVVPPYPDFWIKKSQSSGGVDCYCGNIIDNEKSAFGQFEDLYDKNTGQYRSTLSSSRGWCNENTCMSRDPYFNNGNILCVFSDIPATSSHDCTEQTKNEARDQCEANFTQDLVEACIVELCNSDQTKWPDIIQRDKSFLSDAHLVPGFDGR